MNIVLFEDALVEQLAPLTIGRPAFAITCGCFSLRDLLQQANVGPVYTIVRDYLRDLQQSDDPASAMPSGGLSGATLFVNARLVPSAANRTALQTLIARKRDCVVKTNDSVAAAVMMNPRAAIFESPDMVSALAAQKLPPAEGVALPFFEYPHDVLAHHVNCLGDGLTERINSGHYQERGDSLYVADEVRLGDYLVTDTREGPIVIDRGSTMGPFCFLKGPLYIGPGAKLNEHAALKDGVSLGPMTKVGGEVECSILEAYSNKQHHGFLGHSHVGSWVNLGAGTSNSDLKNTYGRVNMEYRGLRVATGMQFVGCFIGDYAKSAVNTSIFTGKTIGVASMLYGFVTGNVPSFVNYARSFGQVTEAPVDVLISMQGRMFARRGIPQRPCDIELLRAMYERTREERSTFGELASEPLAW